MSFYKLVIESASNFLTVSVVLESYNKFANTHNAMSASLRKRTLVHEGVHRTITRYKRKHLCMSVIALLQRWLQQISLERCGTRAAPHMHYSRLISIQRRQAAR